MQTARTSCLVTVCKRLHLNIPHTVYIFIYEYTRMHACSVYLSTTLCHNHVIKTDYFGSRSKAQDNMQ